MSELRGTRGTAQQFRIKCTGECIGYLKSVGVEDADTYCAELRETIYTARDRFYGVGGQWVRGWEPFPRLRVLRDLSDRAVGLYDSYADGVIQAQLAEQESERPYRESVVAEWAFKRDERQKELSREIGDGYQDLLLFVGDWLKGTVCRCQEAGVDSRILAKRIGRSLPA